MFVAATLPQLWSNVAATLQISDMIVAASVKQLKQLEHMTGSAGEIAIRHGRTEKTSLERQKQLLTGPILRRYGTRCKDFILILR